MAKQLVDDIRRTESDGEKIISEAEVKAKEITDSAIKTFAQAASEQKQNAVKKAEEILSAAKETAEGEKLRAEKDAQVLCDELRQKADTNRKAAVNRVIEILKN